MSDKPIWKFTIKRENFNELYFGFTFADTEEEAKSNIIRSIIKDSDREIMRIVSINKMEHVGLVNVIGGAMTGSTYKDLKQEIRDALGNVTTAEE